MTETITGTNRSGGISFAELLELDSHPVSDAMRIESPAPPGNTKVPAHVYYSKAWHDLEVEKLWKRVWQLACLEEEIPEVGDYHVYEIASLSFLIVRTAPDEIKAYRNACLHRGRKLRECSGKGAHNLRCAFHGWAWNLDGSLKEIPCEWDFPDVEPAEYGLAEALVDTWQGFVFINPDRDAGPLAEFLEGLDEHFTHLPFTKRYKAAHVRKIMPMNWKVCQEAFMEAYHTVATHPTLMENLGDANSRYDVYKNFSRAISPHAVESPHLANMTRYERLDGALQFARWRHPLNGHIY
jgi:phenylpropionate dioxygenase-like ring-hydroxylating dioxygenase large terminal subunit